MIELSDEEVGLLRISAVMNDIAVLDFYSPTCMPCKKMMKIMEQMEDEFKDNQKVNFYKIDATENSEFVERCEVLSLPTIIVYNGYKMVGKFTGIISKAKIMEAIVE